MPATDFTPTFVPFSPLPLVDVVQTGRIFQSFDGCRIGFAISEHLHGPEKAETKPDDCYSACEKVQGEAVCRRTGLVGSEFMGA